MHSNQLFSKKKVLYLYILDAWNDQERSICFPRLSALLFHQHLNSNFKDSKT